MCGISGVINLEGGSVNKIDLERMNKLLVHRGPDDQGIYTDGSVGLANRRLAIIDLSSKGHQPMSDREGKIWITFNGEIFNYRQVREKLEQKGYRFLSNSDTEVIIYAYKEFGDKCLNHFIGQFAFAVYDKVKKKIFLARDRIGINPLYYSISKNFFIFASEIKAIIGSGRVKKIIDKQAIFHFLSIAAIPQPYTIFRDIKTLPPGFFAVVDLNTSKMSLKQYYDIPVGLWRNHSEDKNMLLGELESVMESSVKLAATSDVPIGVFLSGGIDSSLITAFLAKGGKIDIKTFTSWTPDGPNYDERKFAKLIANRFQTQHQEFSVSEKDVLEDIAKLVYYQDQPDGGALETYFISQKAKGLKVAISGTGGDELFGGYHNEVYNSSNLARMYNFSPKLLRKFLISSLSSVFSKKKDFFRIVDEFLSKRSLEERRFYLFFPYSDEEKYSLISKEWLAKEDIVTTLDYFSDFYQRVKDIHPIDRFSYLDLKLYTPTNILQNIDKSAMAHSLEVRSPFLDQRLIEFAAKVPPNLKRRGNIGKYIVKEMAKNILPKEVITHKKTGFGLPRGRYMRGRLKPIIRQFLSEDNLRKRGIFNIPYVNTILSTLDSDNPKLYKDNMKIWLLFILEVWFRIYLDNKITDPDKIKLQDLL